MRNAYSEQGSLEIEISDHRDSHAERGYEHREAFHPHRLSNEMYPRARPEAPNTEGRPNSGYAQ